MAAQSERRIFRAAIGAVEKPVGVETIRFGKHPGVAVALPRQVEHGGAPGPARATYAAPVADGRDVVVGQRHVKPAAGDLLEPREALEHIIAAALQALRDLQLSLRDRLRVADGSLAREPVAVGGVVEQLIQRVAAPSRMIQSIACCVVTPSAGSLLSQARAQSAKASWWSSSLDQ